jgi:hypothetical protein
MTTLRDITIDAFRESGIVAVGDTPDGYEFTEAFSRLTALIASLFGTELGENLTSYDFGVSGVNANGRPDDVSVCIPAPTNVRLICNVDSASTLYLDPNPRPGARFGIVDNKGNFSSASLTIDGNGRRIEGGTTLVCNTDLFNREWFYRDDLASWTKVTALLADDPSPLPAEFDDFLITLLAMRINPRYGAETKQETALLFADMTKKFKSRYRQSTEQHSEYGIIRLPSNRCYYGYSSNFSIGRV